MAWSLDWFAAEAIAKSGKQIRRAGWTDRTLGLQGALWMLTTSGASAVVEVTDFTADDFNGRDWTDQPFSANPCSATPAFNTAPIAYGQWTDQPIQLPPPVPGFV